MIKRQIADKLLNLSGKFRVVTITGPRQSGKTTLAKKVFGNYDYVSLENIDTRLLAKEDPRGFLKSHPGKCIIDEIQLVPELLSYIQTIVDKENIKGRFILTGSQNLLLLEKITQSLAGRTALVKLLPLSLIELRDVPGFGFHDFEKTIHQGFYPSIYADNIPAEDYYAAYIETYVQRDVRQIQNIRNLTAFTTFIKLCAGRTGQILDYSSLACDAGVSVNTAKDWVSVLEASYIIFRLQPYYKNFKKRLIKSPKLYFYDTGLASYLLNIKDPIQLSTHYLKGSLFENFIILEFLKNRFNQGLQSNIFYWRDNKKNEIDCIVDKTRPIALEIKSGKTFTKDFIKMRKYWQKISGIENKDFFLVYGGERSFDFQDTSIYSWNNMNELFRKLDNQ
jgi:predicted AAA+ superfamily ATPase